jgi:hypothetical protein
VHGKRIGRRLGRANLAVRVHDLKHTFDRRRMAAGVCFKFRQDLLDHRSVRITTHYSAAEISNLIEAGNKACKVEQDINSPTLTLLRWKTAGINSVQVNVRQPYASTNIN